MKRSYEERIRSLQANLDQASSKRQEAGAGLEAQLTALIARQAALEQRASLVNTIAEKAGVEVISLLDPDTTSSTPGVPVPNATAFAPTAPVAAITPPNPFQLRLRPAEPTEPQVQPTEVHGELQGQGLQGQGLQDQGLQDGLERAGRALASLETRQLRSLEMLLLTTEGNPRSFKARSGPPARSRQAGAYGPVRDGRPARGCHGRGGPLREAGNPHGGERDSFAAASAVRSRFPSLSRNRSRVEIDLSSGFATDRPIHPDHCACIRGSTSRPSRARSSGPSRLGTRSRRAEYSGASATWSRSNTATGSPGSVTAISPAISVSGRTNRPDRKHPRPRRHHRPLDRPDICRYEARIGGAPSTRSASFKAGIRMASAAPSATLRQSRSPQVRKRPHSLGRDQTGRVEPVFRCDRSRSTGERRIDPML